MRRARYALAHVADCAKHRLHFLRSIYDAARHAGIGNSVRRRRSDNSLCEKPLHYFLRLHSLYIEADDSGGKILITRRVELNMRHPRKSLFHRSEEHTSELQSHSDLVCRLLLEKKKKKYTIKKRSQNQN